MTEQFGITELRAELGISQTELGLKVGVSSKSRMSEIENSGRCTAAIALAIESLSNFRIDAAKLCPDVAKSRTGFIRCGMHAASIGHSPAGDVV